MEEGNRERVDRRATTGAEATAAESAECASRPSARVAIGPLPLPLPLALTVSVYERVVVVVPTDVRLQRGVREGRRRPVPVTHNSHLEHSGDRQQQSGSDAPAPHSARTRHEPRPTSGPRLARLINNWLSEVALAVLLGAAAARRRGGGGLALGPRRPRRSSIPRHTPLLLRPLRRARTAT